MDASDAMMTPEERDAYLSESRIGLLCIEQADAPPLAIPMWYGYAPEIGVWVVTADDTYKAKHLKAAGRYTLVVHDEPVPHRYVSVEGPIVEIRPSDSERDIRSLARRYVGSEGEEETVQAMSQIQSSVYIMKPNRWRTMDQTKVLGP